MSSPHRQEKILIRFSVFALTFLTTLASANDWTPSCATELSEFDYISTSPQKFHFGSRKNVSSAYEALAKRIGRPENHAKPTLFFVTNDFSRFTHSECAGEKCRGMDVLLGEQKCGLDPESKGARCTPMAAVYKGRMYCLLEPSLEEFEFDNPFRPYE